MSNIDELTKEIEKIIVEEKSTNPDLKDISPNHARLLAQIVDNFHLTPSEEEHPQAKMIYLGAPTGAGKDTLVRRIIQEESTNGNFVVLNMDMFRHYHNEITGSMESIADKDFAHVTNQTSYEIYYLVQEVILRLFPGTNVIVTGTMKDLSWVKEIVNRYKKDKKTKYSIALSTLAVPIVESAFSIFERYLSMVQTRGSSRVPLRYTTLNYHKDTTKEFISNVHFFEDDLKTNEDSYFEEIKVYKRSKHIEDMDEDILLFSKDKQDMFYSPTTALKAVMYASHRIDPQRLFKLLGIVEANEDYLKGQNLYKEVLTGLEKVLPSLNIDKSPTSPKESDDIDK